MKTLCFGDEMLKVELGICPFCNNSIKLEKFRDLLSVKEYKISGLCPDCQDKVFEAK